MKLRLADLTINCTNESESISFADFNYFHGPVGAGKTTIAKLIDFCFGGDFEPPPILQPIFRQAELRLSIDGRELFISRDRDSERARVQWEHEGEPLDLDIHTRRSGDVLIHGTDIAVLSDLLFHLANIKPPKVRRARAAEESDLVRLSFRDLFWYCYLDQDSMDSSFFNLDNPNPAIRNKSRDVLRFMVGFHQERVSELEAELDALHEERIRSEAASEAIRKTLEEEGISSANDLRAVIEKCESDAARFRAELRIVRDSALQVRTHATQRLQQEGRELAVEIEDVSRAISELQSAVKEDRAHRNTLRNLALRQRRAITAREELSGLDFEACPQCFQKLPPRDADSCPVCGQPHSQIGPSAIDDTTMDADARARAEELDEKLKLQTRTISRLERLRRELTDDKAEVDLELNEALKNYDSAYLSSSLDLEKRLARLAQKIIDLKKLESLAKKVVSLAVEAERLGQKESAIRATLRRERELAERDRANLELLQKLFLDCLVRSRLPGIAASDHVEIRSPNFLPEVVGTDAGNIVTTSFANISSGGKKNLFKCCFAVAIHRLAVQRQTLLPSFVMIDSPMKNISERVNVDQWEGFNEMLYQLADGELKGTQFVVIDKEHYPPEEGHDFKINVRFMTPNDPEHPPLLRKHISGT
jgi:hypothetical protein